MGTVDLCFWALLCGSYELSHLMWSRCRCPLRVALLAQEACRRIQKDNPTYEAELRAIQNQYKQLALGILDNVERADERLIQARRLILSSDGAYARLGKRRGEKRPASLFDVALHFDNKDFAAHPLFQKVVSELPI